MLRGIYTAASGMINTQAKQDATANNIANAATTGFKQDKVVATPFPEVVLQNKEKNSLGVPEPHILGSMPFGVETGEVFTDFKQGDLQDTGSELDLAINGKGFFAVRYFDGIRDTIKYTRDGNFKLDSDGKIVTADGGYLLAKDMETEETGPITANDGKVTVDKDGTISVDNVKKYSLIVNDFVDYKSILKEGKNNYTAGENVEPVELQQGEYSIEQGKLEQSNIDIASEMVSMIANARSFQANQKVIQSIDETLGKSVNEIGALK